MASSASGDTKAFVDSELAANKVWIASKTTCGYCARVKSTLASEYKGLEYKVVELNTRSDGRAIQDTLAAMTGQRTVPNVFVGGKSIGGCDDTMAMHRSGSLRKLFKDAGALPA